MLNTPERITTDILVIGGGSSGLWTAKGAKEADPNADVLIVDKSFRDWGGLMHLSGGDLEVCRGGDSAADWVKDFTYYWDGLCQQDVMETIWQQSHEIFEEYQRLGCTYLKDDAGDYRSVPQRSLDHVRLFPVAVKGTGGPNARAAMIREMERLGVRRLGRIEITELIKEHDRIVGAVGFNYVTGQPLIFQAKAVVIAAGIASWKPSYNQNTACGEGPCLAFRAGAVLRNFEFLHIWNVPRDFEWEGQTVLMPLGAKFVNREGEVFMNRYSPILGPNTDPHYITRGMALETLAGRGPITLDLSAIEEKDHPIVRPKAGRHLLHYDKLIDEGIDFFRDKFEWITQVQLSNGAVETGENGETAVKGLYCAGRCRSLDPGVYMGGFALMTTAITGRMSGRAAAEFIAGAEAVDLDTKAAVSMLEATFAPLSKEGVTPAEVLTDLQRIITPYDVSILKTADALHRAQQQLQQLREEKLSRLAAADPHYLLKLEEVKAIADVTEYYLTAALFREDSRAGHFRADFPARYDDWLCWVDLYNEGGRAVPKKKFVPTADYKFPVERFYCDNFTF